MLITSDILKKIEPKAKKAIIDDLAKYLTPAMEAAGINTANRVAHFLAQAAHESDGFKTLQEYWGPTAAQKGYEGRKDLGNVVAGDGSLFRGRGIFQITGRANYKTGGKAIGEDLITDPTRAATGEISVKTAVNYWVSRNLNELADHDDVTGITKKINGGKNGLPDRIARLNKIRTFIPEIMSGNAPVTVEAPVVNEEPAKPQLVLAAKGITNNETVKIIQLTLNHKGYSLDVDGDFGPATEKAVKDYQKKNGITVTGRVDVETYHAILKV
jgi:putative chitinase